MRRGAEESAQRELCGRAAQPFLSDLGCFDPVSGASLLALLSVMSQLQNLNDYNQGIA